MRVQLAAHRRACDEQLARVLPFAVDGVAEVAEMAGPGTGVFEVLDGARRVGAFVLEVLQGGAELHCTALAGESRGVVLAAIDQARVEARAIGARRITCDTQRPGLVRVLRRLGWRETGRAGAGVSLSLEC